VNGIEQRVGMHENKGPDRRGRLLVVDDERQIGNTLKLLLQPECEVVPLTSAREALRRLAAGERFDLIFCDLMMPEMTGMDFHDQLRSVAPAQADRIVFMTGGVFSARSRDFLETIKNPCLDKPFDIGQLMALIRDRIG
jgi:CheY-like chemotaxis protein